MNLNPKLIYMKKLQNDQQKLITKIALLYIHPRESLWVSMVAKDSLDCTLNPLYPNFVQCKIERSDNRNHSLSHRKLGIIFIFLSVLLKAVVLLTYPDLLF